MIPGAVTTRPYSDVEARADIQRAFADHLPTIQAFHELVYRQRHTWQTTRFEGYHVLKLPQDLWTYHEWIHLLAPSLVIETGTAKGGSALYFARQMEAWEGEVVTIDLDPALLAGRPVHPRIQYVYGSSVDPWVVELCWRKVHAIGANQGAMVVLDSCHDTDHVLAELDAYAPMVSLGQLLVVEDTNIDGPRAALEQWLPQHPEFQPEPLCERWLQSFNPSGWLRRVS